MSHQMCAYPSAPKGGTSAFGHSRNQCKGPCARWSKSSASLVLDAVEIIVSLTSVRYSGSSPRSLRLTCDALRRKVDFRDLFCCSRQWDPVECARSKPLAGG